MGFEDADGVPLVSWDGPEEAFEAWKACSAGRPCDYTELSYARLRTEGGIRWGGERLYADGSFFAHPDECEDYGKDLLTGATQDVVEYRSLNPDGLAMLKAAEYVPAPEEPSEEYPLTLLTGRTVYHFHTRTKTARTPELYAVAPDAWVEIGAEDAASCGVQEGDLAEVASPRGRIEVPVRIAGLRRGTVFVPFHYGYWDDPGRPRAANELTLTSWDPCSKQPLFNSAAVRVRKIEAT